LIDKKPVKKLEPHKFIFNDLKTLENDIDEEFNERSLELCSKPKLIELLQDLINKPENYAPRRYLMKFISERAFDKSLYNKVIGVFEENLNYQDDVWKLGLYHNND